MPVVCVSVSKSTTIYGGLSCVSVCPDWSTTEPVNGSGRTGPQSSFTVTRNAVGTAIQFWTISVAIFREGGNLLWKDLSAVFSSHRNIFISKERQSLFSHSHNISMVKTLKVRVGPFYCANCLDMSRLAKWKRGKHSYCKVCIIFHWEIFVKLNNIVWYIHLLWLE